MSRFHVDSPSRASDPGRVPFSRKKLHRHFPRVSRMRRMWNRVATGPSDFEALLEEHLDGGDSRAAVVVSVEPLLVAAFTDELDCVVLLRFPAALIDEYSLARGSRLLTVNTYVLQGTLAPDLEPGPLDFGRYPNYFPLIAEFLSEDLERIEERKREISHEEWARCHSMGEAKLRQPGMRPRDGSPYGSRNPAG